MATDGGDVSTDDTILTLNRSYSEAQLTTYEPIRVLGKGAFGEAVLYRRVEDNALVVWKEVDLKRLSEKERKDSQNEIDILSILNHANIVCYYNHYLDGDTLLIEMEYANGGNLYEKIATEKSMIPEEMVLWYFIQLVSAVDHIHEFDILHRDIKTLNIFLTKSSLVKVGDFGISKTLDSKSQMANSYVGTPYYMSPELIKGDLYNKKSDIWAVGCVLYELLTLTKVFDATNPLKLASEIVRGDFEKVDSKYSEDIRNLCNSLLNKDPDQRPSAPEILDVPFISQRKDEITKRVWDLNSATRKTRMTASASSSELVTPVVTSKISEVYFWGGGKLTPQKLEVFHKGHSALEVAAGHSHFAVVTVEKELYTWANVQGGAQIVGQLGHGDTAAYKNPKKVEMFEGIGIKQASCGEDFTLCVTDEGALYSFGSDYYGCLGCDNEEGDEVCTPVLIEFFASRPVQQISCGDSHCIALTKDQEVYSWGCGEFGRLGLGSESDFAIPQKVETRGKHATRTVHAGPDCSFIVKSNGRVLACGSNEYNKLGFNSAAQGLRKNKEQVSFDIPCKYNFAPVKPLSKFHIISVSPGKTHTGTIDLYGQLIMFGSNKFGQLGLGDCKERKGVNLVTGPLTGKKVDKVACGDSFTVIATSDNQIYSWGLADNGRLGIISSEKFKASGTECSTFPRPIFGSLQLVTDISCQHWNTVLVAEKVIAQKTIRGQSPKDTYENQASYGEAFPEEEEGVTGISQAVTKQVRDESVVPEWLKAELADSEFIPVDGDESPQIKPGHADVPPLKLDTVSQSTSQSSGIYNGTPSESDSQLSSLLQEAQGRVKELEQENKMLKEENSNQKEIIQNQALTVVSLQKELQELKEKHIRQMDMEGEIWQVVSNWQQECLSTSAGSSKKPSSEKDSKKTLLASPNLRRRLSAASNQGETV